MPPTPQPTTQLLEHLSTATPPADSAALILGEDDFSYSPGSLEFLDLDFSGSSSPLSPALSISQHPDLSAPTFLAEKVQAHPLNPQERDKLVNIRDLELSRRDVVRGAPQHHTNIVRQPPGLAEPSGTKMLQRLAQLNVEASKQISSLELLTWGGPGVLDYCSEAIKKPEIDPLAQMMNTTAELGNIIEEFMPLHASVPKTADSLTMPIALLCVSCYLQLLHIFDFTFGRVYKLLSSIPDIDQFFALAPKFTLHPGLPPVKGRFYLKIMVQTIKHQLGNVEQLLRLPPGTSVIGRSVPEYGFCVSTIFHIAMEQSRDMSKKTTGVMVESIKRNIDYISSFATE